ncbi:MAG: AzlD domain-containing protein [Actinobacteria bacterium]|nr:AzlD domain-containing protein [Actinomycetota bacterium]
MPWSSFLIIFALCAGSIFAFRVIPMLAFADRELPQALQIALGYIPVAAFAALVANDLFVVEALSEGLWPFLLPFIAATPVVFVAVKTNSLAFCIVTGVAAYAILLVF